MRLPKYDVLFGKTGEGSHLAAEIFKGYGRGKQHLNERACWTPERGEPEKTGYIALAKEFNLPPEKLQELVTHDRVNEIVEALREHNVGVEYADSVHGPGVVVFIRGGYVEDEKQRTKQIKIARDAFRQVYEFLQSKEKAPA